MPCVLTQGYNLSCSDSYGGTKSIYIMELENASAITAAAGVITAITKVATKKFFKYNLVAHTADGSESMKVSREAGTVECDQSVKFPINKMSVAVRNELMLLAKNRLLIVIVDENGSGWLYGKEYGMQVAGVEAKTGVQLADRNGYELSFEGKEKELALSVDAATLLTLETAGA